jgi:hypothetical protein
VISSGATTAFTALTGQTVTINRSTSGRKSVAVVSPVWLFGTDDYMQVANNDLLNFTSIDSFSLLAIVRHWADSGTNNATLAKRGTFGSGVGYALRNSTSTTNPVFEYGTGSGALNRGVALGTRTLSKLQSYVGVKDADAAIITSYLDGIQGGTGSDTLTGSFANTLPFRIGRFSSAAEYIDMELIAVAVFRRALTASEVAAITAYYENRLS